jgi:hypothetical protein
MLSAHTRWPLAVIVKGMLLNYKCDPKRHLLFIFGTYLTADRKCEHINAGKKIQ